MQFLPANRMAGFLAVPSSIALCIDYSKQGLLECIPSFSGQAPHRPASFVLLTKIQKSPHFLSESASISSSRYRRPALGLWWCQTCAHINRESSRLVSSQLKLFCQPYHVETTRLYLSCKYGIEAPSVAFQLEIPRLEWISYGIANLWISFLQLLCIR